MSNNFVNRVKSESVFKSLICVVFFLFTMPQFGVYAESLWGRKVAANTNLFADNRARNVGDTVTVIINEQTDIQGLEGTQLDSSSSFSSQVDASEFFVGKTNTERGRQSTINNSMPNITGSHKTSFDGEGDYESTRDINFRLTAMVTERLGNGNMLIEGKRSIGVNKERYTIRVSGIIRPIDINDNNIIMSEKIANASITLEGKGFLTRTGKRGWGYRLMDVFWPF